MTQGSPDEVDPALVVVFDLAGTVEGFRNAAEKAGLQFLTEQLEDRTEPDEDFHYVDRTTGGASEDVVANSLYVVMSNATAIDELIRLFGIWQQDPSVTFERGLGKFKDVFAQLRTLRRWGAVDRIKDTGLLEQWRQHLELIGGSYSPEIIEIELWYRGTAADRNSAETTLRQLVTQANGRILADAQIGAIAYHALLVELPVQQVQSVIEQGAESIKLLNADQIMFVSPYTPMSIRHDNPEIAAEYTAVPEQLPTESRPRIALLDGLPLANHDHLRDRLIIDDPDSLGSDDYPVSSRRHGTAMASLIIHGDLSKSDTPIDRPLYCRPIMQAEDVTYGERFIKNALLPDLLHRALRRMFEGEAGHEPTARSVRIVNLSIGSASRALIRRVSPTARLLDWLAVEYNLLFVVSAGNHTDIPLVIPASSIDDLDSAKAEVVKAAWKTSRLRGIMPPGDALNVLTVGATHADGAAGSAVPDTVWDITEEGAPSLYGAVGPGLNRSVKPELHHSGGRSHYVKPVDDGSPTVSLALARTSSAGPGTLVAAPGIGGSTNALEYTHGTSNATALVTREANRIFDTLETTFSETGSTLLDPQYHPALAKALLVHASSWANLGDRLQDLLAFDQYSRKSRLTALLGYGRLDASRAATAAGNRAVVVAGGAIGRDERHTYNLPLPISLQAKAEWHRVTVTLASMTPTVGRLARYRTAKVFFQSLYDDLPALGKRAEADHHAVRRGTCQHEIFESNRTLAFTQGDAIPIHVECQNDAHNLPRGDKIRYALVVSIETAAAVSTTIHEEVRAGLRAQAQQQVRDRLRAR
ncbi:S8 family peptidase [Rhodococcus erythropolis]|uniref:S8 family peptidase n=1 Tax=Rhodococcus erythropolis TaxID=1833 RepID=UPI0027DADAA6|nr:S8 family peptidase [Rhodococcus erythropolis]